MFQSSIRSLDCKSLRAFYFSYSSSHFLCEYRRPLSRSSAAKDQVKLRRLRQTPAMATTTSQAEHIEQPPPTYESISPVTTNSTVSSLAQPTSQSQARRRASAPLPQYTSSRADDETYLSALRAWAEERKYVVPGQDGTLPDVRGGMAWGGGVTGTDVVSEGVGAGWWVKRKRIGDYMDMVEQGSQIGAAIAMTVWS